MLNPRYGYVLFFTSAAAFRAEKVLAGRGGARLVPTPRELSSDCGVALRFDAPSLAEVRLALDGATVPYDRLDARDS